MGCLVYGFQVNLRLPGWSSSRGALREGPGWPRNLNLDINLDRSLTCGLSPGLLFCDHANQVSVAWT